jgi:hypothetical protein
MGFIIGSWNWRTSANACWLGSYILIMHIEGIIIYCADSVSKYLLYIHIYILVKVLKPFHVYIYCTNTENWCLFLWWEISNLESIDNISLRYTTVVQDSLLPPLLLKGNVVSPTTLAILITLSLSQHKYILLLWRWEMSSIQTICKQYLSKSVDWKLGWVTRGRYIYGNKGLEIFYY